MLVFFCVESERQQWQQYGTVPLLSCSRARDARLPRGSCRTRVAYCRCKVWARGVGQHATRWRALSEWAPLLVGVSAGRCGDRGVLTPLGSAWYGGGALGVCCVRWRWGRLRPVMRCPASAASLPAPQDVLSCGSPAPSTCLPAFVDVRLHAVFVCFHAVVPVVGQRGVGIGVVDRSSLPLQPPRPPIRTTHPPPPPPPALAPNPRAAAVVSNMLTFLEPADVLRAGMASRDLRLLSDAPALWLALFNADFEPRGDESAQVAGWCMRVCVCVCVCVFGRGGG